MAILSWGPPDGSWHFNLAMYQADFILFVQLVMLLSSTKSAFYTKLWGIKYAEFMRYKTHQNSFPEQKHWNTV